MRIGSSRQPEIIQEEKTVLIGFDGQCQRNVDVSASGSIVYSNCRGTKRRVVVEYVGPDTVNVEVAKRIVVLERRGDLHPEELRDEVFVYIGGLPKDIKREVQKVRIIAGLTKDKPATEQRIFEVGEEVIRNHTQKKQIILIGVDQKCDGILRMIQDRGRKLVQCVLEGSRNVVVGGKSDTSDTAVVERKVEIVGSRGSILKSTEQREIVIEGGSAPDVRQEAQEMVIQGQSASRQEVRVVGKDSDKTESERTESVIFGQGPSGSAIQGKIIEIFEAAGINIQEEKKYVEIGMGASCNQQLHVFLNGSSISCRCEGKESKIQYIGKGPTDFEVMHQTFIIEGGGEMSELQNQDFVIVYVGGIPERMKSQHETVVVTEVFSPEESRLASQRNQIIELGGGRSVSNKNQRQIVLIGVSRKCDGVLEKVAIGDRIQIHCTRKRDREVIIAGQGSETEVNEVKITKQIAVGGKSETVDIAKEAQNLIGDHYEKVLLIRGVKGSGVMIDNEILQLCSGFKCEDYFDIMQEGSNIMCKCVGNEQNVAITYTGSSPTDFYISKHREIFSHPQTDIQTSMKIYLGGRVQDIMRERRIVEIVKNMTSNQKKSVQKQIRFVANSHPRVHQIIEFGITRECSGRWDKIIQGNDIVIVCRKTEQRVAISRGVGKPVSNERIVVQGKGQAQDRETVKEETIVLQGGGNADVEVARETERIVVQGQGPHEKAEVRNENERVVVQGKGSIAIQTRENERIVVQGKGSEEAESLQRERIVVQGRGSEDNVETRHHEQIVIQGKGNEGTESRQNERIVVQGKGSEEVESVQRERVVVQGRGSEGNVESTHHQKILIQGKGNGGTVTRENERIVVQGKGSEEAESVQRERIVVQGRGSEDNVESTHHQKILIQGKGNEGSVTRENERIVVQGKGSEEAESVQRERIVVQGRGSEDNVEIHHHERTVIQGKGNEGADMRQHEKIVVQGKGSEEAESVQREKVVIQGRGSEDNVESAHQERIVVQGKGNDHTVESRLNQTLIVQGQGSKQESDKKRIVLQGGGQENDYEIIKKNETVIVQGQGPLKSNNTIVLQGGRGALERETVVFQGQGPDEVETRRKNKTLVLQGKGTDIDQEEAKKNETLVVQGRDADVEEAKIRKEINKTIVVKGEGPEEVKKERQRVILTGVQKEVEKQTTTTPKPTTPKPEVIVETVTLIGNIQDVTIRPSPATTESVTQGPEIDKEFINLSGRLQSVGRVSNKSVQHQTIGNISTNVIRIVLIGNHEYVNLNQSNELIEIETKERCEGNIKVTSESDRLSIKCVEAESGLDIVYIGSEDTNIEIKTHTRLKQIRRGESTHDKVYIHLGGFKQTITDGKRGVVVVPVRRNLSEVEERLVYVNGMKERINESVVRIVDVGIRQTGCADNSLGQYMTEDGTVIYCGRRRADILPEEYDRGSSGLAGKEFEREILTVTGSQNQLGSKVESINIGQVSGLDGEFIATTNEVKKELHFKVTSRNVSQEQTNLDNRSDLSRNVNRTFSSSVLRVTGKDVNETESKHNVSEEDKGPTRGDLSIAEYDKSVKDEAKQGRTVSSSSSTAVTENGIRQLNVEVNETVDIDVGNNCKGKVEVMESDGQVIVKCTVGGDIFEINLVGLYQKSSDKLNEQSKDLITEKETETTNKQLKATGEENKIPDHLFIQEVEYASHMRYLDKQGSGGNILIRKMNLIDSNRNQTGKKIGSPQIEFMETGTVPNLRRGDVPIDYPVDDNFASYGYQSDSKTGNEHNSYTRSDWNMRSRNENQQRFNGEKHVTNKLPGGNYATRKYGIDVKFIDHKYDDLSIGGFQHAFSTDFRKGVRRFYNREKYNIPTVKGSRVVKRIKTLYGSRHLPSHQREYHRNLRHGQNHRNREGVSNINTDKANSNYFSIGIQQDTSVNSATRHRNDTQRPLTNHGKDTGRLKSVSDQKDFFLAKSKLGAQSDTTEAGLDSVISSDILLDGLSKISAVERNSVSIHKTDLIKGKNLIFYET